MHRVIVCLATASLLTGFASAQTINVPEGDWVWNAELNVNGLTLANSGSTCLTRETSELSLSEIVGNLNDTCSISDWNEEEDTIYFALKCSGEYLASMTGEIALTEGDASLTLAGAVRLGDAGPVTTVINGKAVRNGVCAVPSAPVEAEAEALAVAVVEELDEAPVVETEVIEVAATPEAAAEAEVIEVAATPEVAVEEEVAVEIAEDAPKAAPVTPVEVTTLSDDVAVEPAPEMEEVEA